MTSLNEDEIYAILSRVGDEEEAVPPNDLDSEVEDILETDSEQPTDASTDSDDEPLRVSNISRRRRINSSDSSDNTRPTEEISSGERQQAAQIIFPSNNNLKGKNGHKWSAQPSEARTSRTQSRNIVHIIQGPKNEAKNATTPLEQFKLFFSDSMVSIIVLNTNVEISTKREKYAAKTATVSDHYSRVSYLLFPRQKKRVLLKGRRTQSLLPLL
ncbi:unnamed protein product [Parnassius apollo]|uniref:(apollo) hypothetical protein n=1 Tax=Parnassius apollo TaxID=110799 RepID=A0A8S3XCP4_PARAO|nr:unnamed protein product [Parnassius apollo]